MFQEKSFNQFNLNRDDDTFTFLNNTGNVIDLGILASSCVFVANPLLKKGENFVSVNEKLNYLELVNDKEINPKNIKGIRYIINKIGGATKLQLPNPFKWVKQDANGKFKAFVDFPVNLIRLDQFQSNLVDMYYDNLIIGLSDFLFLKLETGWSITMTFVYDDFRLSNLINDKERNVLYSKTDIDKFEYLL